MRTSGVPVNHRQASIPHVCWWDINTGNGWSQHLAQSHNAPDCLIAPQIDSL